MRNKLILDEDFELNEEEVEEIAQDNGDLLLVNSIISNLIQEKWQTIDNLNGYIATLQQAERPDVIAVISDMISDNYIHIGQLEKMLEVSNPDAAGIEAGKDNVEDNIEATDNLDDVEVEVEPVEEEPIEDEFEESLEEDKKGFLKNYKSGKIHDAGDSFIATDANGKTLGSSNTVAGAEAYIDEVDREADLPADDVDESLVNTIEFKKQESAK